MNRKALIVLFALVAAALVPASRDAADATPTHRFADALDYDLSKVRAAMARGAKSVGMPSAEVAEYMAQRPMGWRHSDEAITIEQPDGSTFRARGLEVSEGGGQATVDGHLIARAESGWWHYGTRQDNGRIVPGRAVVGRHPAPAASEASRMPSAFRAQLAEFVENSTQLRQLMSSRAMAEAAEAAAVDEPVVFKIPALMYEVNNADVDSGDTTADPFLDGNTAEHFEQQLSGIATTKTGTVTEMYLEQSFGKMVIEIDVYGPYSGVNSNVPCYYGTNGAPVTGDVLGLGGLGSRGMAEEAVPLADADGVDFTPYDNNGDNWLDFLMILHSGPDSAATGNPCHVWSHYFGSIAGEPTTTTNEGILVGPVLTIPEIDLQIGVTAHEIMHALGEPDYYGTAGTVGTGDWDLGAGGSWSGIPAQTNPVHFNPVMKINFGWVQPTRIDATALNQQLRPRASYPDLLQVPLKIAEAGSDEAALCDQAPVGVPNQNTAFLTAEGDCLVEGFLIENVNAQSAAWGDCVLTPADFDRQLFGSGLIVWHWDFTNYESLGNDNVLRPMLDIEEFDRRDNRQELGTGVTRGQPLDVFWGDPVGISGATQVASQGSGLPEGPAGWSVSGAASLGETPAEPVQEWTVPAVPQGAEMTVTLEWGQQVDDWNLAVDQFVDGDWSEVGVAESTPPGTSEQVTVSEVVGGARYRARAYNYAAVTSETAEVTVDYTLVGPTLYGPAGTRDAESHQTGWQITNIRPNDYTGIAHEAALPRTPIVVDVIKHDATTVDVSGDFLTVAREGVAPVIAGQPLQLLTNVYNHGGKAVSGATFSLYDRDPATGAAPLATQTKTLGAFERGQVQFAYTPKLGNNDLYVVAAAPGDLVAGNNIVKTELEAFPGGGDVLIVDNDFGWTFEQDYEAVLNGLGVSYDVVDGEPTAATLAKYDAVIWITTTASGDQGTLSDEAVDDIATYLDGGGKLWMASTRVAGYLTTRNAEWLTGYFGLTIDQNLLNSPGKITGQGGPVGGTRTIKLGYLDGRPYIDYGSIPTDGVSGEASPLFKHEATPLGEEDVVATSVVGESGFRTVYGIPLGLVLDAEERATMMREVLTFFGVAIPSTAAADALQVRFNRFQLIQDDENWTVTVGAVAPGGVDKVELVHRPYGAQSWRTLPLTSVGTGLYTGTLQGLDTWNNGLEYYVRVTAGGTTVDVDGGPRLPNVASAPYGLNLKTGMCAPSPEPEPERPRPAPPAPPAPLPATGAAGWVLWAAAVTAALGLGLARRRRGAASAV